MPTPIERIVERLVRERELDRKVDRIIDRMAELLGIAHGREANDDQRGPTSAEATPPPGADRKD